MHARGSYISFILHYTLISSCSFSEMNYCWEIFAKIESYTASVVRSLAKRNKPFNRRELVTIGGLQVASLWRRYRSQLEKPLKCITFLPYN